jgi:hypothetical protein
MGSAHYVANPTVPLDQVDLMICMDLVGHALGPPEAPVGVRQSLFALGAERSDGTAALVDKLIHAEPGVVVRRADAEVIPPLSDHWAFWQKKVPFLLLTCGRWQHYHLPTDTPEKLDYEKMAATARWLEKLVRARCEQPGRPVRFTDSIDDASTLATLRAVLEPLLALNPAAESGLIAISALEQRLDEHGRLPPAFHERTQALVESIEAALA